jgi:hypothetical protein
MRSVMFAPLRTVKELLKHGEVDEIDVAVR